MLDFVMTNFSLEAVDFRIGWWGPPNPTFGLRTHVFTGPKVG
jgi:hypothetical protein